MEIVLFLETIFLTVCFHLDAQTEIWDTWGMKEALSRETERTDARLLVVMQRQQMHMATLLETHVPTHGLRTGRSRGERTLVRVIPGLTSG